MIGKVFKETRTRIMSSVRSSDAKPDLAIRNMFWSMGFRHRTHNITLSGMPCISNKRLEPAVFIDGCFGHENQTCYSEPQINADFWKNNIYRNRKRMDVVKASLEKLGFHVVKIWKHNAYGPNTVLEQTNRWIGA